LLLGGAIAALVGFKERISFKDMLNKVSENLQSVTGALLILLFLELWREHGSLVGLFQQ
jgi:NhaC family Na+:H+ antiporter